MFLVSNRYSLHVTVIVIACVAAGVNLRFTAVRAESGTFGERSLLYSLVTKQSVELIEEYANTEHPETYATISYIDSSTFRPDTTNILPEPTVPTSTVLSGGTLLTPSTSSTTKDTLAPRESVIAYVVENGDTLSTIAEKFGISLNTLLWANNLSAKSVIKPGNSLTILPVSGISHTVAKGDTITSIAKKYSVSSEEVLAYNKLTSSDAISVGTPLIIPGGVKPAAVVVTKPSTTASVGALFVSTPSTSSSSTLQVGSAKMLWPTDGTYIVRGLSLIHTGVDIDCDGHANGTSTNDNYAAADGTVQFAGVKNGYGNVVEINHGNGLVTRYGHFYSLYVKTGQVVTAGTPLGRCGSTGNSSGTHLHFEVIINGKFQNPLNYIR